MYESPSICGNKTENMIDLRLTAEQELPIRERAMPYNKLCGRGHRAEAARAHRKHWVLDVQVEMPFWKKCHLS